MAPRRSARRGVPAADRVIRVLLADDHAILRAGLRALLRSETDIQIVAEAGTGDDALALAQQTDPDVVVLDLNLPKGDGLAVTKALVARRDVNVLILTMRSEEEGLIPSLEAGAKGYLMKQASEQDLVDAIRTVAAGEVYVRPAAAHLLATNLQRHQRPSEVDLVRARCALLSDREQTVFRLVAEGYNGPEIGRQLHITAKTVDTYKQRIESKIGIAHRTEYVRLAVDIGLLSR